MAVVRSPSSPPPQRAAAVDGANDGGRPKEDDSEETAAGRDGTTRKAIPASPRGTKRDGGKNDRTGGGGRHCPSIVDRILPSFFI